MKKDHKIKNRKFYKIKIFNLRMENYHPPSLNESARVLYAVGEIINLEADAIHLKSESLLRFAEETLVLCRGNRLYNKA